MTQKMVCIKLFLFFCVMKTDIKSKWNNIISQKLKEGVSLQDLYSEYESNIVLEPNIVAEQTKHLEYTLHLSKHWINMAAIFCKDNKEANRLILKSLNEGANGIYLGLQSENDIDILLEGVKTEYIDLKINTKNLTSENITLLKDKLSNNPSITDQSIMETLGKNDLQIPKDNKIESTKDIFKNNLLGGSADIVVTLSKNLFFETSYLRALRLLLNKNGYSSTKVVARYDVEGKNTLGDYNLIEKSYKVISAILGSANIVLTEYDGSEDSRLALNIHNVLELESGFKNVLDPVSGAYYLEKLTEEIIKKIEKQ